MKISISLSEDDVRRVDRYAAAAGLPSRSAVIQHALGLLEDRALEDDYAQAWEEWESSGEAADWETTTGDGLTSSFLDRASR